MSVPGRRIKVEDAPFGRVGEHRIVLTCDTTAYSSFKPRAVQRPSAKESSAPQSTRSEFTVHRFPNTGERYPIRSFGE
ncbi:hypothetical protein OG711_02295 [Streptomyces uncialis]|uniref:hypothetical protein n=1 Tax=Streptomyces uncialis TaxID=1048205 RepID=UPI002E35D57B|nr:hypothetical protein [Streptomyces uncialis]